MILFSTAFSVLAPEESVALSDSLAGVGCLLVRTDGTTMTNAEWRAELAPEIYEVTRCAGTEFAFANRFWDEHRAGLYRCTCCATALFRSEQKFDSGTGWPSFTAPIAPENLAEHEDRTLAEIRTEVLCSRCDAHLGHVFHDGPMPLGLRYCVNSAALAFIENTTKS